MDSKIDYWFLLTKIAVVEDGIGVIIPALDDLQWSCWWWDGSSTYLLFSNPSIFQSPISNAGLDFGCSNSTKIPPNSTKFVQSPLSYLGNYYCGNWKIQLSPNCPKMSQFPIQSPKSNFQRPKIIQPERYHAGSTNYYYFRQ
jgi:hypothetical protein